MNKLMLSLLKALIVALLAGGLLAQFVFIPWIAWASERDAPQVGYPVIPYAAMAIAAVVCAQVILVATWKLAGMVQRDKIFDLAALKWVTLMVKSAGVATAIVGAVAIHAVVIEHRGPVTVPLTLVGGAVGVGAVALVLMVLRELLHIAVKHKVELDEVI